METGSCKAVSLAPREFLDLLRNDLLEVGGAMAGMGHGGGVHIDLKFGLSVRQHVGFKLRRDVDHEGVTAGIHSLVDLIRRQLRRRLEEGLEQRVTQAPGEWGAVLIDDGDGSVL